MHRRAGRLCVDRPLFVTAVDFDAPWLGVVGNRNAQPQHTVVIARLDPIGIEVLGEEQLATENAARPSIGVTAGCAGVPSTCRVQRSNSRSGSVRINILSTSH